MKAIDYVFKCEKEDCPSHESDVEEYLDAHDVLYTEVTGSRRWWDDTYHVIDLKGTLIGFGGVHTTGDGDTGWEFDPESIGYAERHEETKVVVTYRPVETKGEKR